MELFGSLLLEMINGKVAENKIHPFNIVEKEKKKIVITDTGVVKKPKKIYRKKITSKPQKVKLLKPPPPKKISMKSYETRIRALLEAHTNLSFKKRRMKEMKNPLTGKALELDLYCEELKLGVEYQGIQHQRIVKYYHPRGQLDLDDQIERDQIKRDLCITNRIALVLVHYGEISECMLDTEILKLCIEKVDVAIKLRDTL